MLQTRENRLHQRQETARVREEADKTLSELMDLQAARAREKHEGRTKRIHELEEEREKLLEVSILKKDFLPYALGKLQKQRKRMELHIQKHLAECHKNSVEPFPDNYCPVNDFDLKQLFWLILSDEKVERLINGLPEGEMSAKKRDARLKAIDDEIKEISGLIKADLEALKES